MKLAAQLELPTEIATAAIAIIARRGRGKTYTAAVLAEELHAAGQPFVVLDPTGAWWGLRASADGTKPGLPVTIIGGDHGDVPLEPTAGKLLAPLVDAWPDSLTKDDLAAAAGYSPVGGGFNNPLGRLRTLELVNRGPDIRLTDDFGEAIS